MAELAVSTASLFVQLLLPFLHQHKLKKDLLIEIERMKSWLGNMKGFIQDNDSHSDKRRFQNHVEQVREIAYEIEDVLDDFVRHSPHVFHNHRITQKAHKFAHTIRHGFPLGRIPEKITTIRKKIEDIQSQNATFFVGYSNSTPASSSSSGTGYRVSPLLRDDEMVGYEDQKKEFIRHLMNGEKQLVTLAVVGPSGSGKTTFVKNVYWEHEILGQFDYYAWVHVSRHFDVEELLVNLLKQFCVSRKEECPTDDIRIQTKLKNYLLRKRYIVVLDDIWTKDHWDSIKDALPNASCGSRIVVTTRNSNLASICSSLQSNIYKLEGLEWLEGWNLFCKKAFQNNNGECRDELQDISVKIVKQCERLLLSIVAVGGALAQKPKLPNVWKKFHSSFGFDTQNDSHMSIISNALLPSYTDLSSNQKGCFLYFSIFPEDYSVEYGRLIRLWVAERFVMEEVGKTAEDVAAEYLNDLIHRNLIHVSKWDFDGRPRCCRVLKPIHKFIIQKCKDENFASILSKEIRMDSNKIRRLSVQGDCTNFQGTDFSGVRSLFLFRRGKNSFIDIWNDSQSFQYSKVIDFQGAPLITFPKQISRLFLLRYLCLRDSKIKYIPKSIDKLPHLETLDLKQTDIRELPKEISRLLKLRHLFAYKYNVSKYAYFESVQGVELSEGISNLTELQNLSLVRIGKKSGIIKDLKKLEQLRKLGLLGLKKEHGIELCESIKDMENLTTLDLCAITKGEFLDLESMSTPPSSLQRLYLKGRMERIPSWISSLVNLFRIGLKWSKMKESPLKVLQCLPNLMELHMTDCYVGDELVFEASGFKKLKILIIEEFFTLHTIVVQEESMPDLQEMSIQRCKNLMVISTMQNLTRLNKLVMYDVANEFIARVRKNGEDREMVEHIPVIHSFTLNSRCWSFENLSN